MDTKYEILFDKFKELIKKQNLQKQRGLNNYNLLTTVLKKHDEVNLHSKMIYSLINPKGEHFQDTLFLEKFVETLNVKDFNINIEKCSVFREYKNIDLYITDGSNHIIIENKVYAGDQPKQIKRYVELIMGKDESLDYKNILVIYLSLNKDKPSEKSLGDMIINDDFIKRNDIKIALFKSIHYKDEILNWLKKSQYEIQNITNLNEVFRQYIDVVNMLNYNYKGKIMSLGEELLKNKEDFELAKEISKAYAEAEKIRVENNKDFFTDELASKILDKFNEDTSLKDENWIIKGAGNPLKKYDGRIRIFQDGWKYEFNIQFKSNNMKAIYWRFAKNDDNTNLEDIRNKFDKLKGIKAKTNISLEWDTFDKNLKLDTFEFNQDDFISSVIEKFKEVREKFQNVYSASFEDINN